DTQVSLTFAGDAQPGTDYTPVNPLLVLRAGKKSASVTVDTLANPDIQPSHYIVASIAPSPTQYSVVSPGSVTVTISGEVGAAARPILTLRSAQKHLTKGEPYMVDV